MTTTRKKKISKEVYQKMVQASEYSVTFRGLYFIDFNINTPEETGTIEQALGLVESMQDCLHSIDHLLNMLFTTKS